MSRDFIENIDIRDSSDSERPIIHQIIRRAWEVSYAHIYTPQEIDKAFTGELTQYASWAFRRKRRLNRLVAVYDGQLVGAIGLSLLHDRDCGEVTSFYVDPTYQGYGIGMALWDAGLKRLQESGCQELWVWVLEQAPARSFYEHRGCTQREQGTYRIGKHAEVALGYWRML